MEGTSFANSRCRMKSSSIITFKMFRMQIYTYCHTRLHLGFSAKLRIWQASACKMEPRSGYISCKTPTHPPCHLSLERLVSQHILIRYSPYIECRHIGLFGTGVNCHSDICPELQFYFGPPNLHFECGTPSSTCLTNLTKIILLNLK